MSHLTNAISFPRRRKRLRIFWIAFMAVTVCGLLWIGYIQWLIQSAQQSAPPGRSQVAIVLGAALWNDRPSPGLRERLDRAYELYKDGTVQRLIVSGGLDNNGATITEAEGMKRYLAERGIPEEAIVEENEATSTYENLLFSKRIMDREGWTEPVIVTHQYHGARAIDIARFIGIPATVSLTESKAMWMPWHKFRETLAYTKWLGNKLIMRLGL